MFDLDSIMALTDTQPTQVEKIKITYAELKAALKSGYISPLSNTVKKAAVRILESLKPACPSCSGTGMWSNNKYSRPCFRCKGKGELSNSDILRNATYDGVALSGQKTTDYSQFENTTWAHVA